METNEVLRQAILETVDNQIKLKKPPATVQTLERLKKMGYSEEDARLLIGQCVAIEIFYVFKESTPFDEKRFINNLNKLPDEPFDD
jgi:hypothetical protein